MTVHVCFKADLTASRWDWFKCVKVLTSDQNVWWQNKKNTRIGSNVNLSTCHSLHASFKALSNLSDSVPPGFNFANLAASLTLVSKAACSAACAAAFLSSSEGPPFRHCFDQLSARPTLAVIKSSETRGRGFVTKFNIACNCLFTHGWKTQRCVESQESARPPKSAHTQTTLHQTERKLPIRKPQHCTCHTDPSAKRSPLASPPARSSLILLHPYAKSYFEMTKVSTSQMRRRL